MNHTTSSGRTYAHSAWFVALVLALPFLAGVIYTDWLTRAFATFHGSDEYRFHFPVIEGFAKALPTPSLADYQSATTPLFHLSLAVASTVVGLELPQLRLINVLISWLAACVFYAILVRRVQVAPKPALLFGLLFALSPYFFGVSFILLTDNLAVLMLMAFLYFYLGYEQHRDLTTLALALLFLTLALLTRQTLLYALGALQLSLLFAGLKRSQWLAAASMALLPMLPLVGFFWLWQGLTPPSFQAEHTGDSAVHVKSVQFGFAVIGFYGAFLVGNRFVADLKHGAWGYLAAAAIAVIVQCLLPMPRLPNDDGFLWRLSTFLPSIAGSSPLFFLLIPLGACVMLWLLRVAPRHLGVLGVLCFLITTLPHRYVFQKYYDVNLLPLLIIVVLTLQPAPSRWLLLRSAALLLLFAAYAVAYQFVGNP